MGCPGIGGFHGRVDVERPGNLRRQPGRAAPLPLSPSFGSSRVPRRFREAAVASSHGLATDTAYRVLAGGGNAVDAAVAASATLSVAQPMMCGVGGDVFALIWLESSKTVLSLNGSGRSPKGASLQALHQLGHKRIPESGPLPVTVPGAVAAWHDALRRCGTRSLDRLLRFAIDHASNGLVVDRLAARSWRMNRVKLTSTPENGIAQLLGSTDVPDEGDRIALPQAAETLKLIAMDGPEVLYRGHLGEAISTHIQRRGGWMQQEDLAAHTSLWVNPLSVRYRGAQVFQCPPNSQGVATLIALDIAGRHDLTDVPPGGPDWFEIMVTAARSGMRVAIDRVADPATTSPIPVSGHSAISGNPSLGAASGRSRDGDTAYVGVIDADGNGCSMISSLYHDFGSGLVVPGTGIVLNNRGTLFDVDARSPNALAPGKLPYHTIMPCLVSENGSLSAILGVVGGFQQPQAQLQILSYLLDYRLHPQDALDRPRFRIDLPSSERVLLEEGVPELIRHRLAAYAPEYVRGWDRVMFGGAQALTRNATSIGAGSDLRSEGSVAGW